ncbi:MAG: response regulator [Deltaproteobacteria bacterium]|nr:response regulator [Deltaproteobacteria bacterium]
MSTEIKEKILFVDDEKSILDVASEFFEFKGYRIFTACNGRQAVSILEKEKIDCCFTDINMPEMDGIELAGYIYKNDNTIPVVIMTGYPSLENTIRTMKNGVVDFLIKPVNLNQMEICLRRVLRERKLFVENIILKKEVEGKERLEKLNSELLSKIHELGIMNTIMSDFATMNSSSLIFKRIVDITREMTPADEARFFILNSKADRPFEVAASAVAIRDISEYQDIREDTGFGADAIAPLSLYEKNAVEKLLMETAQEDLPLLIPVGRNAHGLPETIGSMVVVPMNIRDDIFGVLAAVIRQRDYEFSEKDLYYLSFMLQKAASAIENLALYENIYENLFSTLYGFVKATEVKDPYTQQHSDRVTDVAIALAEEMRCNSEEIDILNVAGRLHDIGKIGIKDEILLKPGRLADEEYEIIKEHPVMGADIVSQMGLWEREQEIIRCHHERFDGNGYPDGLKGDKIPLLARILSVADVYDALSSDRAYRKKMDEKKVLQIISDGAGSQFDPVVVDAFMRYYKR